MRRLLHSSTFVHRTWTLRAALPAHRMLSSKTINAPQVALIADKLKLRGDQVEAAARLLDEDCTVPFITRYRRDQTGGLDENEVRAIAKEIELSLALEARKATVLKAIEAQGKSTPQLTSAVQQSHTIQELEDIYLPFKVKRKTLGFAAREAGAGPLADMIFDGKLRDDEAFSAALAVLVKDPNSTLDDEAAARNAVMLVLAERMAEHTRARRAVRQKAQHAARLSASVKDANHPKVGTYQHYAEFEGQMSRMRGHQVMALNRAEEQKVLRIAVDLPSADLQAQYLRSLPCGQGMPPVIQDLVREALADSWKRLVAPSVVRELRKAATERAHAEAVESFVSNLRSLLLTPPVRGLVVLALDPGYRGGCKLAIVDATGEPLPVVPQKIYPHVPQNKWSQAKGALHKLIKAHGVQLIAVGDGTASHETESLAAEVIAELVSERNLKYTVISESGASVYSVSKEGQADLPEMSPEERSAISLARRLQDPLAELVKVDPAALGVGMYQHDVAPKTLETALSAVVESCVSTVGVDVNTASVPLLAHVAGLNQARAKKIVAHRTAHGAFADRASVAKVAGVGAKSFEQSIGFLRVYDGTEPLDTTEVHPESYATAKEILELAGLSPQELLCAQARGRLEELAAQSLAQQLGIGTLATQQVLHGLSKPGHDPRDAFAQPVLRERCRTIKDLASGEQMLGAVKNVAPFGAFVDIGVGVDGLLHTSQIRRLPSDMPELRPGSSVEVQVGSVDVERKRIALNVAV